MAPRVLFLGTTYAGWNTRFQNLRAHTQDDPRIRPIYRTITGWRENGLIERLPGVPRGIRGRARGVLEAAPFASLPRPDVIWIGGVSTEIVPHLWAQLGRLRRPVVAELDWTLDQQEAFAPAYYGRPPRRGVALALARLQERLVWHSVAMFTPMSTWAAASLRRQGIAQERVHVLHPGLDLADWQPRAWPAAPASQPLRLLFVGGDFERKGGSTLLEVFRACFADRCQLDLVTPADIQASPGVRVHRAGPNSQLLRDLYAQADVFVLPTHADCFGHVAVEALASAVPVIATNVGGLSDIVDDGDTGWLIEAGAAPLAEALERALALRARLPQMGRRGRAVAEQRFDGPGNDRRLVDLLLNQAVSTETASRRNGVRSPAL